MKERWNRRLLDTDGDRRYYEYEEDPDNPFDFEAQKLESDEAYRRHRTQMGFTAFFLSMLFMGFFVIFLIGLAKVIGLK